MNQVNTELKEEEEKVTLTPDDEGYSILFEPDSTEDKVTLQSLMLPSFSPLTYRDLSTLMNKGEEKQIYCWVREVVIDSETQEEKKEVSFTLGTYSINLKDRTIKLTPSSKVYLSSPIDLAFYEDSPALLDNQVQSVCTRKVDTVYKFYTDSNISTFDVQTLKGGTINPSKLYEVKEELNSLKVEMVKVGSISFANNSCKTTEGDDLILTDFKSVFWSNKQYLPEEIVSVLVENYTGKTLKGEEAVKEIFIEPSIKNAINSLLSSACTGIDMDTIVGNYNSNQKEILELRAKEKDLSGKVDSLSTKLASLENRTAKEHFVPPAVSFAPVEETKDLPKGEVVWTKAAEVFQPPKRFEDLFNFDVPVWFWYKENEQGEKEEVNHPLVPTSNENYIFKPTTLPLFLWGLIRNKKIWLSGHTGTGKSSLVEEICARLKYPLYRINFDSDITRLDLIGRDTLSQENGTTVSVFEDGILPQALTQPCILLMDEIDCIRPEISYVMQRALEDKGLLVTEDGGRFVQPHEMFRFVATGNSQGQGDDFGYQGVRTQSMAFLDRFTVWLDVDYLKQTEEKALLKKTVPDLPEKYVKQVLDYVKEHRAAFLSCEISQPISPRGVTTLAEAITTFTSLFKDEGKGLQLALEGTILNKANPQDRSVLKGIIDRVFATEEEGGN